MKAWPVQEAKAKFSALLEASLKDGPQVVTKRGVETAVLIPMEEWKRLKTAHKPDDIKDWLLAPYPKVQDLLVPPRRKLKKRPPVVFE